MRTRSLLVLFALALAGATATVTTTTLPTLWRISAPTEAVARIGNFPQGLALSPDGTRLAIIEAGAVPASLRVMNTTTLATTRLIPLQGGFGTPVWVDGHHVLVAAGHTNLILELDTTTGTTTHTIATGDGSFPVSVAYAPHRGLIATADDLRGSVSVASLHDTSSSWSMLVGIHPGAVAFSPDERTIYAALSGERTVVAIDVASQRATDIAVGLHPCALAVDTGHLYVADCDDDDVRIVDRTTHRTLADLYVGVHGERVNGYGASPNALALDGSHLYVSLGAANAVASIDLATGAVRRAPAGWYPSGIAVRGTRLFVTNAKGESSRPNPQFTPFTKIKGPEMIAYAMKGSLRELNTSVFGNDANAQVFENAKPLWTAPPQTIVRANGPIKHVIYIIKENRTYDEMLSDLPQGDGDRSLLWFGQKYTPNQHAMALRFGIFDRTFADAQVSADGHNWSTAAFANDYLERFWPAGYADRRSYYDFEDGAIASVPHNGYLWDDAARSHLTYRDYGEFVTNPELSGDVTTHMPHLIGHIDPKYPGFDLRISDEVRFAAWKAEFDQYVAHGDLPQLEIVRLPDDHTAGARPGYPTPQVYVARNDYAFGRIVEAVSHSPYWNSTAIFAIEDDAQNGPDHVDDQRTTFYLASPYAKPGVHHESYTTASVLHTIELLLGMPPMSIYDDVAPPMYEAFGGAADLEPFTAVAPTIDMSALTAKTAYGARESMRMDLSHADDVDTREFNDILAHAVRR